MLRCSVLRQDYAGFGGERHYIEDPVGKRKEGGESGKYLKKYFGEAEKILTFAAPQVGKEKEKEPGGARPRGMR